MIKISSAIFKTFFLSLCIVANTHFAFGQTASILPPGYTQYLDSNGKPLSSGKVYNYVPNTTTLKTTWQDAAETIPNANPVILDAGGRAKILGDGSYRQIVKDRNNNTIWDAVTSSTGSGSTSPTATGDGDLVGTIKPWAGMTAPNQYAFTYGQEVSRTTYSALFTAITSSQSVFCNSGSPTLNGLSDTTNFWIGMSVEVTCVAAGFSTIISKTASTVTLAANANVTTNTNAIFYPWGRGNGTTTFNLPDLRGVVPAGNNNMGGVASANLTATYFGSTDPNSAGALGGSQSKTLIAVEVPGHSHPVFLNDPGHNHTYNMYPSGTTPVQGGGTYPAFGFGSASSLTTTVPTGITVRDATGTGSTANQTSPTGGGIAVSATIGVVGSGYTPGSQTITVSGGTCTTQPQFTVTISGGGAFSGTPALLTAGSCTVAPTNPASTTGGGGTGGTLNVSYSAQPFSLIPPTRTTNFIIKITPDTNSASASGVTSLGSMTGDIACGTGLTCTGNTVSTTFGGTANPTASIGLTAINGTANTALRSDGAPALSQSIIPTWTGFHTFNSGLTSTFVTVPNVYGGGAVNSTLSLQSTSNATPSNDLLTLTGSSIRFQNFGLVRPYYDFYNSFDKSQMQLRGIVKRDVDGVMSIAGIINPGFSIDSGGQRVGDIDFLVCGLGGIANADCNGLGTGESLQAGLAITGPVSGIGDGGFIPFTDNNYILGWPSQRFKDLQVVTGTFGGLLTASAGISVTGGITIADANTLNWVNGSYLYGAASTGAIANTFRLVGSGSTTALNFGGDTSSFPSIIRNSAAIKFRLADDSADAAITAGTIASAANTITSISASALAVGRQGATDPVLKVNASTASVATGIEITGAAATGGVNVAAISSGTNENLTLNAKGSGTITLGGTSTGSIALTRATTLSAALTYGGVTLSNAVTGTGNMVLSASPTLTGTLTAATISASGTVSAATLQVPDGNSYLWGAGSASIVGNSSANVFAFYTASTERVRISTGVGIGTTTDPGAGALLANTSIASTTYVSVGTKIRAGGSAPTITAGCNGAGSSISGSDLAGTVTGQTAAATTCTITFNSAYASAPYCTPVGVSSPLTGAITTTTTTLQVNFASTANYVFNYNCVARSGG